MINPTTYEHFQTSIYAFGFLSSIAFGGRFLIQWLASEKAKESVVPKLFWYFSFTGNFLLFLHCFIQQYFPMFFLQSLHMPLALRNLNLMSKKPYPLSRFFLILTISGFSALLLYLSQLLFLPTSEFHWIRTSSNALITHPLIHLMGIIGIGTYSLRFWLQWWESEAKKKSTLSSHFWTLSLIGASIGSCYFFLMRDWVNFIGPTCALLPYIRNLILIKNNKTKEKADIVFIAMEASGDILGAKILKAVKQKNPSLTCAGIIGPEMRKENPKEWAAMESYQVMGLIDVIKKLPQLLLLMLRLLRRIKESNPSFVVFLDSPSFGLKIASLLKKKKISATTVQVVAPSIWAWGKEKRLRDIYSSIDLLIPLFAFEKKLFSPHVKTAWYGHPFFNEAFFTPIQPKSEKPLLALFPGSRPGEIKRNLPLQLETVFKLQQSIPTLHIGIAISGSLSKKIQAAILKRCKQSHIINYTLIPSSERYALMESAWAALAKCGTGVLELFLKKTPTVVCYNIGLFERLWAKHILKVSLPFYSLPNIFSKRMVVQECIHPKPTSDTLAAYLLPLLQFPQSPNEEAWKHVRDQVVSGINSEEAIAGNLCQRNP